MPEVDCERNDAAEESWQVKRRLVRMAKRALQGDEEEAKRVWNNVEVREAVAERFQLFLLLFFACSLVFLFLSTSLLSERVAASTAAKVVDTLAPRCRIGGGGGSVGCRSLLHKVSDWHRLLLGASACLCLFTLPLNGTVLVLVCKRHYSRNIWFCWLSAHYVLLFACVLSLLLLPLALGLYWVIQAMKQYAVTFETNVPLA